MKNTIVKFNLMCKLEPQGWVPLMELCRCNESEAHEYYQEAEETAKFHKSLNPGINIGIQRQAITTESEIIYETGE